MLLIRLSGHSGAGKSRLVAALPRYGIKCPLVVRYTSRGARSTEQHGRDYYFLSRAAIAALPSSDFYVGPVREMLQAVDLSQLEIDLWSSNVVMVELFPELWPGLLRRIEERMRCAVPNTSVFMTAVHRKTILDLPEQSRGPFIQSEVECILYRRNRDAPDKVRIRARSAVDEILAAISPSGARHYARIFDSAPEGPDGEDEWTKEAEPVGDARRVLDEFIAFYTSVAA
jgi:hypothetical protein